MFVYICLPGFFSSSSLPLSSLEMALTEGTVFLSQMPSLMRRSRTSHENTPGFSDLYVSTWRSKEICCCQDLQTKILP